jgi:2,4-dienoyl-CoA reductase (NADPH2)
MTSPALVRYPRLFSPIKMGPLTLRHRATMSGHGMHLSDGTGRVSDELRAYVVTRAKGGASLLGTESAPIHDTSANAFLAVNLFEDAVVPSLARLADEVHAAGSKLSIILWHGGHNVSFTGGRAAVAVSPIPSLSRETPRQLTQKEIKAIVKAYGAAAARCRKAGLDAVEVQTATSYLLGSFLSPAMNHRSDSYGGSLENRMRIVREVLNEVRAAAGTSMAVGVRTSTSHHIPNAPIDYRLEESIAVMKAVSDEGLVDWVSIISGSRWAGQETIPHMGVKRNQLADEGKAFRKVLEVPLIVAGRIRSPADAETMIAEGSADVVAMARTWIAEPEWAKKIEDGREESIRPCMSCSQGCAGFSFKGLPGTCVINPVAGRETKFKPITPAAKPKRVAVVGGGPAGMEAARVAALRGHRVTLYERGPRLGGQMRLAASAPHRAEMLPAIEWFENELRQLQVRVRLNETVAPGAVPDSDEVIWAVGSDPWHTAVWRLRPYLRDGIPGASGLAHGREVLAGTRPARGAVLIIDEEGGWPAISLAETLAARPEVSSVTVVTSERVLGEGDLTFTRELSDVTARLKRAGFILLAETTVARIEGAGAVLGSGERLGPYDTMVLATGTRANPYPEDAPAVGDCVAPRGIWAATTDAARLAREV